MRRKLVKQGNATYTISLPRGWVDRFGLKSGSEINLDEAGPNIVLSSIENKKEYKTSVFDMKNIPKELTHEFIVSLYKSGLRDIELKNSTQKQREEIKKILYATLGLEIISLDKETLNLLDLGTSSEESLMKAEQQIYWRLLHMIERLLDEKSTKEEAKEIDSEINKLCFYIERNIATKFSSSSKNFLFYEKISLLENTGDFLRSLKIYSKNIRNLREMLKLIEKIVESFRKQPKKIEDFFELRNLLDKLKENAEKIQKIKSNSLALAVILIYKNLKQLFDVCFTLTVEKIPIRDI